MIPRCGIIVLSYTTKATADTLACLDSLAQIVDRDTILVYVVAMQTGSDARRLAQHPLRPHMVVTDVNAGFTGGNNLGAQAALTAGVETLVFLNNDTLVDGQFLRPLLTRLQKPNVGVVGSKIYFAPGKEFHHDSYSKTERGKVLWYAGGIIDWQNVYAAHRGVDEVDHGQFDEAEQTDFVTGCCMALRAASFTALGGFDERYFLYLEDVDVCERVKRRGLTVWYEPESVVWHANAGSTGGAGSDLHVYYQTRNRWLFGMRYAPLKTKAALMRETARKLAAGTITEKTALTDALMGRYGKK